MSTTLAPGKVTVRDVPADRRNTVSDVDAALWDLAERLSSTLADDRPPPTPRVAPPAASHPASQPPPPSTPRTATMNAPPPRRTFADAAPPNAARGLPTIDRLRTGSVVVPAAQQIPRVMPPGAPQPPTAARTLQPTAPQSKPQPAPTPKPAPAKSGRARFSILANRPEAATETPIATPPASPPRVVVETPAPVLAETPATASRPVERRIEQRRSWKRAEPRLKLPVTAWVGLALAGAAAVLAFFAAPAWI